MSAATSTRYDFGRCTVEHVDGVKHAYTDYGGQTSQFGETQIVIRLAQASYDKHDEAIATLSDYDARELAGKILYLLDRGFVDEIG